jgi:hypothetical protein
LATQDGVASVVSARIVVNAGDVGVRATNCWLAGVVGAKVVVIAVNSQVEGNVQASSGWIAIIVSASIVVVAVDWSVFTGSSCRIATIIAAKVSVVARNWSGIAMSICDVASNNAAWLRSASDGAAQVAGAWWKSNEEAAGIGASWSTVVTGAWIVVIADLGDTLATSSLDAEVISASVAIIASDVGECASSGRIASISCAQVSISAWSWREGASISSLSWSALIGGALVLVIADIGADTGGTAGAETKATLSTWIAWNINAGSNDETVQNASELREVWSGKHGLDSWNGGGDESDLVDIIS